VIANARVDDWIRLTVAEEIDFVGPIARPFLRRHGVVHPPHFSLFLVQAQHAQHGSMLTGFGGDSVIGGWIPSHAAEVIAGRAWPRPSDLPSFAFAAAPGFVRRKAIRLRFGRPIWLKRKPFKEICNDRSEEFASRPAARDSYLAWEARRRRNQATESTLALAGADVGARLFHPFRDPRFVAALARDLGARGGNRTAVMRRIFAGDLPDDVLARTGKANFAVAYFRGYTRDFARRWDGIGLDTDLVEPELLRKTWLDWLPDPRSALALQAAWISSAERGLEDPIANVVQGSQVAPPRDTPYREAGDFQQRGRPADFAPTMPSESNQSF
jgi:asparagine synthase (glutamine-hydrolysing)